MSHSISNAIPEPSVPGRGHAVGATAGQWPEKKPMWPDRRLVDLLGIEHPLVLAPMAGLGTVELAAAVCAGGGLGSLGCVGLKPESVIEAVDKLRRLTGKPINTNFFCHTAARADRAREANWRDRLAPYYNEFGLDPSLGAGQSDILPFDDALCMAVEQVKPEIVSFHFGLPEPALLARVKAAGSRVMASATTVAEARWLEARGADVIIAQGCEAGGHRGMFLAANLAEEAASQPSTLALVPQIADAVGVPIIAAGGIADGRGIAAAFALGAAGVQIGTAYLFCPEAAISPLYRDALRQARADTTVVTDVFTGRPARSLSNRLTRDLGPLYRVTPDFPTPTLALAPLRRKAEQQGSREFSSHWAGQAAPLGREMRAEALTRALAEEALKRFGQLAG
jgi:nitronate monooxygenase